ncbi:uncharacterized protein LOC141632501 [Silene latifolia]|uniref:uncharacterized protein LOC141632501 n=1 Tax=Silene latifolia TaxID=37657 RepID=UPI003D786632
MPTLARHSDPTLESIPKGFKLPTTDNGTFEIRPSYINLVERNLFGGGTTEDPTTHMERFVTYCCSIPLTAGVTQDQVKKVLFPFSLFYNGLYDDHRTLLDSSANERFQDNTNDNNAWKLIDQIATHTTKYGNPRGSTRGGTSTDGAVATQLETLIAQIAELKTAQSLGNQQTVHAMTQHEVLCERCGIAGHGAAECMSPLEQVVDLSGEE